MHETWIKLYRKAMNHDVFFDDTAWRVWTWILMSVDYETGEMTLGRFTAAQQLRMSPNTFRHIMDRLKTKYDLIETTNKHSHTHLKVKNWAKYQTSTASVVDNAFSTPQASPEMAPQGSVHTTPQANEQIIPSNEQYLDHAIEKTPQANDVLTPHPTPQARATPDATNQEEKKYKEIKNINNSSYEELQRAAEEASGVIGDQREKIGLETSTIQSAPSKQDIQPSVLEGELMDVANETKLVNLKPNQNPDGSFGNPDINEGMAVLEELLGEKPSNAQKNRNALSRLFKKRTKERTLKALRFAIHARQIDRYAPRIYNYMDLESKWVPLEDYARTQYGGNGLTHNKERNTVSKVTYGNIVGGVAW